MVFRVFRLFQEYLGLYFYFVLCLFCVIASLLLQKMQNICVLYLRVQGFQGVFLGFLQILLFKVEKPPFCTVLRLIVNFRHCASPVEQGFVPNHVNPCVCYFPRVQGFRVQSFQGFMVFRVFQVILGIFRVIFLFRIVFVLCDCITFVTKNAKYLCTISQGLGFLGFQGFLGFFQGFCRYFCLRWRNHHSVRFSV